MTSKTKTLKQTASLDELCDWGRTVGKTASLRECLYPANCELQIECPYSYKTYCKKPYMKTIKEERE